MKPEYKTLSFEDAAAWRNWLDEHHANMDGIWVRVYKKGSGIASVTIEEALDLALCYGWIDGQRKSNDDVSYLQKYTPRRKGSLWSKRNIDYVTRLSEAGLMTPAGQAEVDSAKADGRWDAAYDRQSDMVIPADFLTELAKHPKAWKFYATLNRTNLFAIAWRLQTAKTEATRLRRQDKIIAMLTAEEKFH